MKFQKDKMYRHPNNIDVDMYVVDILGQDEYEARLRVRYFNRFYQLFQGEVDEITIAGPHKWVPTGGIYYAKD